MHTLPCRHFCNLSNISKAYSKWFAGFYLMGHMQQHSATFHSITFLRQRIGFLYGFLISRLAFLKYDLTICIKGLR